MLKRIGYLLSVFLFLNLAACSLQPVKMPSINRYQLTAVADIKTKQASTAKVLLVTVPVANSGYDTAQMIYVEQPYQLKQFAKSRWVAPPMQMLLPLLAQSIQNTHYFHAVVTPPFSGKADFRLDTRLLMLQQEFSGNKSQIRMTMQAILSNNTTNKVIAEHTFSAMVKAPANSPYGGVVAANTATAQILQNIAQFCVENMRAANS